jgi:small subunit ribosomal protein S17
VSTTSGKRRVLRGIVTSDAGSKTITVRVTQRRRHPKYGKMVRHERKVRAHDEADEARVGDTVEVVECRPMSRTKRWRLVRIVERGPELTVPLPDAIQAAVPEAEPAAPAQAAPEAAPPAAPAVAVPEAAPPAATDVPPPETSDRTTTA